MRRRAGRPTPADRPRTPRTRLIPDHLWDAFATMASEMGTDRDALVNQAMYTFARLNGFVVPADLRAAPADAVAGNPTPPRGVSPAATVESLELGARLLGSRSGPATSTELPNLTGYGVVRADGLPAPTPPTAPNAAPAAGR